MTPGDRSRRGSKRHASARAIITPPSGNDVAMDTPRGDVSVHIGRGVERSSLFAGQRRSGRATEVGRAGGIECRRVDLVVDEVDTDVEVLGDVPLRPGTDVPLRG